MSNDVGRFRGVLFDLDGTVINSEWKGRTDSFNYEIQKIVNRKLNKAEKQYLLGKPFKILNELVHHILQKQIGASYVKTFGRK